VSLGPVPSGQPGTRLFRLARVVAVVLLAACPLYLVVELVGGLAAGSDAWTLVLPAPLMLAVVLGVAALLGLWWPTGRHPYVPRLVLLAALAAGWLSLMAGATVVAAVAGVVAVAALAGVVVDRRLRRSDRPVSGATGPTA
jgi:hypothetical protein